MMGKLQDFLDGASTNLILYLTKIKSLKPIILKSNSFRIRGGVACWDLVGRLFIVLSFAPSAAAVWHCDHVRIPCESNSVRHSVFSQRFSQRFLQHTGVCPRILKQSCYNLHRKHYTACIACSKKTLKMLLENLRNPSKIPSRAPPNAPQIHLGTLPGTRPEKSVLITL